MELATQGWRVREDDDERMYLIEDPELRRFYGRSIGSLAHSHWWPIARVERDLAKVLGAMPPHTRHEVDLLKLAALLRVADAIHLDRRRAPGFVRALERPEGSSALHWTAQERLAFPGIEDDGIVFTSGEPFESKDAEAWWRAYDSFVLADQELRDADLLLRNWGRSGLVARRVKGAGDPREMVRYVPVVGWRPVETRVRVSDVPKIVETLGGAKLYGDEPTVAVRELLQNAMDAIQARRHLQGRATDWGTIVVELAERTDGIWLLVEDTGVGMSEVVLTGPLVDFGSSFWRAPQVAEEYPGLAAKGMNAIGQFGIGFFSVFMLGDQVRVTTRRYDRAEDDTLVLEFRTGLSSRPILSSAAPGTAPLDGGTRVEVKLWNDPRGKDSITLSAKEKREDADSVPWRRVLFEGRLRAQFRSLANLISSLAPASDVSIDAIEFGQWTRAVTAGDWLTLSGAELADRVSPAGRIKDQERQTAEEFMRPIHNQEGKIVGRAALYPSQYRLERPGALVAAGLRVTGLPDFLGVVPGDVATAARDVGRVVLPPETVSKWATEQVKLIEASDLSPKHKTLCAEIALRSGGSILGLPIVRWRGVWLNSESLQRLVARENEVPLFVGEISHEDHDDVSTYHFDGYFKPSGRILIIPTVEFGSQSISWIKRLVLTILKQEWGGYEIEDDDDFDVGTVQGVPIVRSVEVFRRPTESSSTRQEP